MNINLNHYFFRRVNFLYKQLLRLMVPKIKNRAFGSNNLKNLIDSVYVINLDRQKDRWSRISTELGREPILGDFTLFDLTHKVSAIDGKKLTFNKIQAEQINPEFNLREQYTVDPDPRLLAIIREREILVSMTNEEVAVSLSHISCWKKIVEEQRAYTLILEDDVFFESFFSKKLNAIWQELPKNEQRLPDFDLLYLSYREVDWGAVIKPYSLHLNKPIKGLWWLSGYVLSLKGAKKLIDSLPVRGPVDLWMNLQFSKLDVYSSIPSLIFQRNDLPSGNNYSIMPILSQLGIQSDSTHLELQQKKGRNPVFVLADDDLQIDLLATALSILGYRCLWESIDNVTITIDQLIERNEALLFDAYLGTNITKHYDKLERTYPASVFIWLTQKRTDYVLDKIKTTSKHSPNADLSKTLDKKRNLFFDVNDGNSKWKCLCDFLECKSPPFPFPFPFPKTNFLIDSAHVKNEVNHSHKTTDIYLEHDVTPWILPIKRLSDFGILPNKSTCKILNFETNFVENFISAPKEIHWRFLEDSFASNLSAFVTKNLKPISGGGCELILSNEVNKLRQYSSASISTKLKYLYGRFSVIMKPVKMDGVVTAFFLHRNDPWQEIDFEFLGKDTTRILINVYFNPGGNDYGWNYGVRGTPVLIDLGFDAADDYHTYTILWDRDGISWYV
ncbi:MAG: glycosyl hydrolase family protein, partial [Chryseobacterium sp.]